jgi:predicted Zn finger-like uncharacterized protein
VVNAHHQGLREPVYNQAMNRITRCPSCTTVYQLGDAHLQTAKGWLRCGVCSHVFDSTGLVLLWKSEPSEVAVVSDSTAPLDSASALEQSALVAHKSDRIALDDLLQKEDRSTHAHVQPAQAELAAFEQALSSFKPETLVVQQASASSGLPSQSTSSAWLGPYLLTFLVFWLVLQLAFVQRHAIVAIWPESENLMRHVCQSFGCQVSPLRDPEGVVIDSSSLEKRSEDHLLTWTVRNTTSSALGMTALELSLLDGQGKLVMRRVLLSEQAGAPHMLQPGQSWSGALKLTVLSELSFSDYRLVSFYP